MPKMRPEHKYLEISIFAMIIIVTFFLRFYNASDLSGGDDSQFAELATLAVQDPYKIIYPSFPDEPISWQNLHYSRPFTAFVYVISILIFGYTKYAVVFPATLFSALSGILLYLIVKRQFGEKVALVSASLFVFSPFLLAFSRIGLLHAQLIFLSLLAFYLLLKYFETKKICFIYLSTLCWLLNAWTTDFRGIITAFALLPILYREVVQDKGISLIKHGGWKKLYSETKRDIFVRHFFASFVAVILVYFIYTLIPAVFFSDLSYLNTLQKMFVSATGTIPNAGYLPFFSAIFAIGKFIFLTPFAAFIFVPFIFGLFIIFSKAKDFDSRYMFWLFYLLPIILFYLQGQNEPGRQVVFLPAFSAIAAIGLFSGHLSYANNKDKKSRSIAFPLMSAIYLAYLAFVLFSFPRIFPSEWSSITASFKGTYLILLVEIFMGNILIVSSLVAIVFFLLLLLQKQMHEKTRKYLAVSFIVFIIILNAGFCFAAAAFGIGIYKRSDSVSVVGKYLKENLGTAKYSCITGIHDKSFTFYTGKLCAFFYRMDYERMVAEADSGNLRYFVIDLAYSEGTPGLGMFNPDGTLDETNVNTGGWLKNYPEKYSWILENCADVTPETGLSSDNPYFRVYEYDG